jgi:hypothetical protein
MILAALLLLSGISISIVAEYYSIMGLMAIFAAAPIPIAVMGIVLGIGKLVQATWLKAYWSRLPMTMRLYGVLSVGILMLITTLGCFGFLSKAHSDQTLVSGDSQAKIAVYDEKIRISKDNIDANRKALKQMDEAVDQVMGRSQDEKGADKAVAIRRSQQRERSRLLAEIQAEQTTINKINEEAAPVRAENRKIEAEVGPIKYIAAFVYGDNPDASILERAVTWVIILIVIVFDPLAVVMLLAAQMTWAWYKNPEQDKYEDYDDFMKNMHEQTIDKMIEQAEEDTPVEVNKHTQSEDGELPAYLRSPFAHFDNLQPIPAPQNEPEPALETTPFEVVEDAPNWTLINENAVQVDTTEVDRLRTELDEASTNIYELANYVQNLQQDYDAVTDLHQRAMSREADLIEELAQTKAQLDNRNAMAIAPESEDVELRPFTEEEIMALDGRGVDDRLADGEAVSITEMPQDFREMISKGLESGALEIQGADKPLIKTLEGEAAYNLMKDIGIFNEDGKLAPEYGGEEPEYEEDQEESASVVELAPDTQPEILTLGIDAVERPGDYITDPVTELFSKREPKNGFGNNFPDEPTRGDLFLRTDFKPSRLFKWNDKKWIEVNKNTTSAYSYNDAYIQFLADQILAGVYTFDDLTESEQEQVQTLIGGRRG